MCPNPSCRFASKVVLSTHPGINQHLIPVPEDVAANLPGARARLRIAICGVSLSRALMLDRTIGPCFMVGEAGPVPNQTTKVSLMAGPNPYQVPIPEKLAEAPAQDFGGCRQMARRNARPPVRPRLLRGLR